MKWMRLTTSRSMRPPKARRNATSEWTDAAPGFRRLGRLVRGRPVRRRHGHVQQAQVDRELAAVVDQVAERHVAQRLGTFPLEPQGAADLELPGGMERRLAETVERPERSRDRGVEAR